MTGITSSLEALVSSIVGIFQSIIGSILAAGQSVLAVVATLFTSLLELLRSFVTFLLSNIVLIGIIVGAFVAYVAIQQRQGKSVTVPKQGGGRKKIA